MTHEPINPRSKDPANPRTRDPLDPRMTDPLNPGSLDDRIDSRDPVRDPYVADRSRFGSPGQILVGLVLIIAVVIGLGLLFGSDTEVRSPQTTEAQPPAVETQPAQPDQTTQAPAPAEGTGTNTGTN